MRKHIKLLALAGFFLFVNAAAYQAGAAEGDAAAAKPANTDAKSAKTEEAPKPKPKEEGGEAPVKSSGGDVSGGRFAGDPVYVHLSPMVMPVISDDGVEQLVTIIIDVEVKDFDVADTMHSNMPRVKDALMRALYGGLGQGSLRNGKLVDVKRIKQRATTALGEVVGSDGIREVLIQGIAQRML